MRMSKPLDFAALDAVVRQIERGGDTAEIHGSVCGALCVQRPEEIDLFMLVDAGVPARSRAPEGLKQLRDEALVSLQDEALGFAPLLPDDSHSLETRVEAMAAWCAGFLFGLSLKPGFDPRAMSDDAQEILTDFTELTRASFDPEEDGELCIPAQKAGLQPGHLILSIDGEPASDGRRSMNQVARTKPGDKIRIDVLRNGKPLQLTAEIGIRPPINGN